MKLVTDEVPKTLHDCWFEPGLLYLAVMSCVTGLFDVTNPD